MMNGADRKHGTGYTPKYFAGPNGSSCQQLLGTVVSRIQTVVERVDRIEEKLHSLQSAAPAAMKNGSIPDRKIIIGSLMVDHDARRVLVGDREIVVSPTEYRFLYELARDAGRVVTHRDLVRRTRAGPSHGESHMDGRYLKVYIGRLRVKFREVSDKGGDLIESVRGVGYRLVPEAAERLVEA